MQSELNNSPIDHVDLDRLTHHTVLPQTRMSIWIDRLLVNIGQLFAWIWVILMAVIILNVFMRYVLGEGRIELEELQWHLYAVGWMIGLSYCYVADDHVRVDLIHDRMTLKMQAWVELLGIVFLLMPFLLMILWYAIPFISYSWELGEVSEAPGGLPYRWAVKAVLFIGFALLTLALISRLSRVIRLLFMPCQVAEAMPVKA